MAHHLNAADVGEVSVRDDYVWLDPISQTNGVPALAGLADGRNSNHVLQK